MKRNFRDLIKKTSPWWFRFGNAEKLLYAFGLVFDGLIDDMIQALRLRYPGDNALFLPYHAKERRIRQGKYESAADYAVRLASFFQAHLDRGGPYAMLEQVYQHYRPNNFRVYLHYASGAYFTLEADGTITSTILDLTFPTESWAHWWLVYEWPTELAGPGLWDDPGTWDAEPLLAWDFGADMLYAEIADLRLIPTEWNAAHCNGTLLLVGPTDQLWDYPIEPWDNGKLWDEGTAPPPIEII